MSWLIVSILPRYLAAIPVYEQTGYATVITVSTTLSLLQQIYTEGDAVLPLTVLNYTAGLVWLWYDLCFAVKSDDIISALLVGNLIVFLTYVSISTNDERVVWHLISAAKCFYVAALISRHTRLEKLRRTRYIYD